MKTIFVSFLIGMLIINPLYAQTQQDKLRSIYKTYGDMTYKSILLQSSKEVKSRSDKKIISDALNIIKKNPKLGQIKITQSIDSMSYFFLNHLEKDFIGYENAYSFYKGFRSVYRGMNIHNYNRKCVYRRGRGAPFTMLDFLNGQINCGMPIGYPRGVNKYEVIREIDETMGMLKKVSANNIDSFEAGKMVAIFFTNLLIPNAYALSDKARSGLGIGAVVGIVVGLILIVTGFLFSPTAGIGIPMIAGGAALIATGLGYNIGDSIHKRIKKRKKRKKERKELDDSLKKGKLLKKERARKERESMIMKERREGARIANTVFSCYYSMYSDENELKGTFEGKFKGSEVKACEMAEAKCNKNRSSKSFECLKGRKVFPICTYQLLTKKKKKVKATFSFWHENRKLACKSAKIDCQRKEKWGRFCKEVKN